MQKFEEHSQMFRRNARVSGLKYRLKHGSPKLLDAIREKCRDKMRQNRHELFNSHRFGVTDDESMQETLTELVRKELSDFSTMVIDNNSEDKVFWSDLTQEEISEIEEEVLRDQEQWMMEEYERFLKYEQELTNRYSEDLMKDQVTCLICEKHLIVETPNGLYCPGCHLNLPGQSIGELSNGVKKQLNIHSEKCSHQPNFITLTDSGQCSLYLMCDPCSSFTPMK